MTTNEPVMLRLGTTAELGGVPVGLSQVQGLQATLVATQPGASVQLKVKAGEVVPLSGLFYRVVTVHDGGATHVPGGSKSYVQLEASAEPQRAERLAVPVGASMNAMGFDFAVTSVQGDTVSVEAWPDQHARKNTRPELIKSYTVKRDGAIPAGTRSLSVRNVVAADPTRNVPAYVELSL